MYVCLTTRRHAHANDFLRKPACSRPECPLLLVVLSGASIDANLLAVYFACRCRSNAMADALEVQLLLDVVAANQTVCALAVVCVCLSFACRCFCHCHRRHRPCCANLDAVRCFGRRCGLILMQLRH